MRTEALLREAMDDLAATARTPESALPRVLAGLPTPTSTARRSRRRVLVAALAVVLLVAAAAVPGLLRRQTAEPADVRAPGNWNLIHRVDLPAGWEEGIHSVAATSESSSYQTSTGVIPAAQCTVEVLGAGRTLPDIASGRRPLDDVNGRAAAYGMPEHEQSGRLSWRYADANQAAVTCGPADPKARPWSPERTEALELDFARRVVFTPTPVRLPFELDALPAGYEVHDVVTGQATGPVSGVELSGLTPHTRPLLQISVNPGTTEMKPGLPGQETTTVDGRPAVLSASEGSLCLNDRGYTACVVAGGDATNRTASLWAPGQRELVLEVASHLTVSKHLDDPSRWPDANSALPR